MTVPARQVRARYSATTITVYQAYSPEIAAPALAGEIGRLLRAGDEPGAAALLPTERPYPLPAQLTETIDADG